MATEELLLRIKAIWQGDRATAEASRDIEKVGKSGERLAGGLKSVMSQAAIAGAAIAGAAYTAKKGWDTLAEGAQLVRVDEKFAAAAEHIGTTGDELRKAVKDAMGGMVSDAVATAGALELIDTGLASNQEEVVRLSRLVGELGWDMQALTLTMLNDSDKRLDTLGLSVERVEELEQKYLDLGIAHEQAFDLAVMDAGEEKLAIYGSTADSVAGKMAKIEASWANIIDSTKKSLALSLEPVINRTAQRVDLQEQLNLAIEKGIISQQEYRAIASRSWSAGIEDAQAMYDRIVAVRDVSEQASEVNRQWANAFEAATPPLETFIERYEELREQGEFNVRVSADTDEAETEVNNFIQEYNNKRLTLQVGAGIDPGLQGVIDFLERDIAETDARARLNVDAELDEKQIRQAYMNARAGLSSDDLKLEVNTYIPDEPFLRAAELLRDVTEEAGKVPPVIRTRVDDNFDTTISELGTIQRKIDAIPTRKTVTIVTRYRTEGSPGSGPRQGSSDPDASGQHGLSLTVPAGYQEPHRPFLIAAQSGEHVEITPRGQQRGGGDTFNIVQNFKSREAAALGYAMVWERKRARFDAYMGV